MSKEILNKYIELIDKGYCDDCNELNCLGNFPHKDIAKNIKAILEENKILRENAENNDKVVDKVYWEINLLKAQQKEFIEWLKEKSYQTHFQLQTALIYEKVLSKYKEIIGGDSK